MVANGTVALAKPGVTVELHDSLTNMVSFENGTPLASLAARLDTVAITKSPAVRDLRAARARLYAKKYDLLPSLKPAARIPLSGGGDPSIGLAIEQVVWDGGRIRSGISVAEYQVVEAALTAWIDRNDTIYDGVSAYIDMSRHKSRLAVYNQLWRDLSSLNELLQTRESGGVADRGELLRMSVALQEVQREMLSDEAEVRKAESELARLLTEQSPPRAITISDAAIKSCRMSWPERELPADAIARFELAQRRAQEANTKARKWPSVVAGAATSYVTGGSVNPNLALELDSEDMLGLGRRGNIAAAESNTQSARSAYSLQKEDTRAELSRLEADHKSTLKDIAQMASLEKSSRGSLALYHEQLEAAKIPLTEGITLYREAAETRLLLADLRADLLSTCTRIAQVRGTLAPFSIGTD